ncbi:hypothetical protein DNI29_05965 [Hymenobacter sediminis]|uniref:hypothetical protein n=1 Tax=Hymenobacter sediminis TaxID=2218621 RepID=UPI000DA69AF4|nr:hypothetical protein [Hymenobacter sediminis]RPD50339.1 hypothetical protein DNI29_05965 [Hymenobacter sediminis]
MKHVYRLGIPFLIYSFVFFVFTWPLAANFSTSFLAVPGHDTYQFYWNVWHFREAVIAGVNPFVTDWMFYPTGSSLIMHAYIPIVGAIAVMLGDEVLAINLALLASFALSGLGAYQLAKRWISNPALQLLAGFIFAYSPYKLQRLPEHYNLVLTATVPFYVLAFLRAFEFQEGQFLPKIKSKKAIAWCIALAFITLLSDYYALFSLIYFSLLYASWYWLRIGRLNWRHWRTWAGLAVLLIISHIIIRLMRLAGLHETGSWWGGDLLAYLMPPATSRWLYFDWADRLYHDPSIFNMPGSIENTVFIGYTLPALTLFLWIWSYRLRSLRAQDAAGRPLIWVVVLFLLFTVPTFRIHGHNYLNLPTSILHFIPFFNNIRCPTRWIMMVGLLLPIISFSALEAAWQQAKPASRHVFTLLLGVAIVFEFWPKSYQQTAATDIPALYGQIAALPGTTLIPIPMGVMDGNTHTGEMSTEQLYYQTRHRKKLPGGYLSRVSPALFASFEQQPVLHALLKIQTDSAAIHDTPQLTNQQIENFLRQYRPAAFVIDSSYAHQPIRFYLRELLQPYGFTEQVIGQQVLLKPTSQPDKF